MTKEKKIIVLEALTELRMYAELKLQQHRQTYSEDHCMVQTAIHMVNTAYAAINTMNGFDAKLPPLPPTIQ